MSFFQASVFQNPPQAREKGRFVKEQGLNKRRTKHSKFVFRIVVGLLCGCAHCCCMFCADLLLSVSVCVFIGPCYIHVIADDNHQHTNINITITITTTTTTTTIIIIIIIIIIIKQVASCPLVGTYETVLEKAFSCQGNSLTSSIGLEQGFVAMPTSELPVCDASGC